MEKYIPYEKLSKKEKRKINNKRRRTWGGINPITRKPENSKAYSRKKNQYWKDELSSADSFFVALFTFFDVPVNNSFELINGFVEGGVYCFDTAQCNYTI